MTNKERNYEAMNIRRPLITGQCHSEVEAVVCAIVRVIFGVDLLPPCRPETLWHPTVKQ